MPYTTDSDAVLVYERYSPLNRHFRGNSVLGTLVGMWSELSIVNILTVGISLATSLGHCF